MFVSPLGKNSSVIYSPIAKVECGYPKAAFRVFSGPEPQSISGAAVPSNVSPNPPKGKCAFGFAQSYKLMYEVIPPGVGKNLDEVYPYTDCKSCPIINKVLLCAGTNFCALLNRFKQIRHTRSTLFFFILFLFYFYMQ